MKSLGIVCLNVTILEECLNFQLGRGAILEEAFCLHCMLWSHNGRGGRVRWTCFTHFSHFTHLHILPVLDTKKLGSRIAHGGDEEAA